MVERPKVFVDDLREGYAAQVERGLRHVGFFEGVSTGSTVFLKPNLTRPDYRPGVMTSYECLASTTRLLREKGYEVIIGEADSGGYNRFSMDAVYEKMRIRKLAEETGTRLVNISLCDAEPVVFRVGRRRIRFHVPALLLHEVQAFISLPVPKVHLYTRVSLAIKNQWGCIQEPAERLQLHPDLPAVLFELNRRLPRAHAIVDGRFGLTASGPLSGRPVELNWLLVSDDLVAADRVACRLMQFDEDRIPYLRKFRKEGWWVPFGNIQLNQPIDRFLGEAFHVKRRLTDLPGLLCFRNRFFAWLGYRSPLAGLAHKLLYLVREPFYDYDGERAELRKRDERHLEQSTTSDGPVSPVDRKPGDGNA